MTDKGTITDFNATLETLREKIAYIPQETFLFSGTILENLTFGMEHPDMEEVIACGDEGNDREMLLAAGLGAAMGNGSEAAKSAADVIVADCDHDGVAAAIEKFCL